MLNEKPTFVVCNPATGAKLADVPDQDRAAARAMIDAARAAQPAWGARTAGERSNILRLWGALIRGEIERLAAILTAEQGKPLREARAELVSAAAYLEWFAEEGRRVYGDLVPTNTAGQRLLVLRQPIGVAAAITPWNFPASMITRKAGPALAAGCALVVKPAAQTPLTALALSEVAARAGVPPEVFAVLTTTDAVGVGLELTTNPHVAKVSFTGSTEVGKLVMSQAASTVKRVSLELGGNAPFIVFEDADIDAAVEGAVAAKFRNAGQTCVCANRIYVQSAVHDVFVERLAHAVAALRLGDGSVAGVDIGPLIDNAAIEKVELHIRDAVAGGARVVLGGGRSSLGGAWFEPTVLADVDPDARVSREETFGPLAPVYRFRDEAEVLRLANDTRFGLAAYFYARDLARVWRVAEALEYGMVGVNTGLISTEVAPFGGIKQSGLGREGGRAGIEDYLEIKYVCLGGLAE